MKATLRLKLLAEASSIALLLHTTLQSTECFNAVCRYGWEHHTCHSLSLHHATYHPLRQLYPQMPSQLMISVRSKAAEALKSVQKRMHQGRKASCPQSQFCPIRYDARSYTICLSEGKASLVTLEGRVKVAFHIPACYECYLCWKPCSADLCYDPGKKRFHLHVVVQTDPPEAQPNGEVVGYDLGIKRIAVTSTPTFFSSQDQRRRVRQYEQLRSQLQAKGTKSAKKHLKKLSRRWTRFVTCQNHLVANAILAPMHSGDVLVIEDLTGIRNGCPQRKKQRGPFHRWSFAQLRAFLLYKAQRRGIVVVSVDPAYSSQTCSKCGHCQKKNRRSQSRFCCQQCGYRANADYNAAQVLRQRGIASLARLTSDSQSSPICHTSSCAQAPGKALYEDSSVETQRVTNPAL